MALHPKDPEAERLARALAEIRKRAARLPILDDRPPDELVGYDEHGLPRGRRTGKR